MNVFICTLFIMAMSIIVGEVILYLKSLKKIKKELEKQEESIKNAFKQISKILTNYSKIVKLIQKLQSSTDDNIAKVVHDIDDLYRFNTKQVKVIGDLMKKHNELVNDMYDQIRDVHCDLNEGDCSTCEYHAYCTQPEEDCDFSKEENLKENDFKDFPKGGSLDSSPISCVGENRITIDPFVSGSFDKLEEAMSKSGVPKEVINNYIRYIKNACKTHPNLVANKVVEIVWMFGNNSEAGVIKHKFFKDKEEKLVNPNAKIVKTLNRLYEQKDN